MRMLKQLSQKSLIVLLPLLILHCSPMERGPKPSDIAVSPPSRPEKDENSSAAYYHYMAARLKGQEGNLVKIISNHGDDADLGGEGNEKQSPYRITDGVFRKMLMQLCQKRRSSQLLVKIDNGTDGDERELESGIKKILGPD